MFFPERSIVPLYTEWKNSFLTKAYCILANTDCWSKDTFDAYLNIGGFFFLSNILSDLNNLSALVVYSSTIKQLHACKIYNANPFRS